jgi:hypothetical protein
MNNKIILSIHHKYSELILTEKKTLEIRKSAPRRGAWSGGQKTSYFYMKQKRTAERARLLAFSLAVLMRQQTLLPCTISKTKRICAAAL